MALVVSKRHKALIVPKTAAVANVYKGAPELDGNVVVPHDVRNTLLLRHMGFQCPSPILCHYNWPTPDNPPFHVQELSAGMLVENPRAYVLNDKGTGKTRTALWAWHYLYRQGLCGKLLVVAPRSVLRLAWANEAFGLFPELKVGVLYGRRKTATRDQRLKVLASNADIYIINHDGLRVVQEELAVRSDINALVIDELSVYRNPSQRQKGMVKFADPGRWRIVWGLTGSPMPEEPTDVWCQCRIITPHTIPARRRAARDLLMQQVSTYRWVPKKDAVELAFSWMQPSVRYTLGDVIELPEIVSRVVDVPLSIQQEQVYKSIKDTMVALVKDKTVKAVNSGVVENKLIQVAGGWVYTNNPEFVRLDADPRVTQLIEDIEESAHKVLVFVPYRHMIEGIAAEFAARKCPFSYAVVHGDTPDRDQIFTEFQNDPDKYKVLLTDPTVVSHGLTLTAADTCIWYVPIPSFDRYDQANARFRRIGQKNRQLLLHYQSLPVERKRYRSLQAKDNLQMKLLDLFEDDTAKRNQTQEQT